MRIIEKISKYREEKIKREFLKLEEEMKEEEESMVALVAGSNFKGKKFNKKVWLAGKAETRECYHCGEAGHLKNNCPKLKAERMTKGAKASFAFVPAF